MDRLTAAQARLHAAFDRLEAALRVRAVPPGGDAAARMSAELERVQAENASLRAAKAAAADQLDATIARLKTLLTQP